MLQVAQDISLNNHVPALKRILEQFVYRVKAMLALHGCHQAMWVGNLKNKDIKVSEPALRNRGSEMLVGPRFTNLVGRSSVNKLTDLTVQPEWKLNWPGI